MSRKIFIFTTSTILSLVLLVHFAFTFIYLSPPNPFRAKYWDTIYAYMNPYFTQNWKLFAPKPANQHLNLDIRVQFVDASGKVKQTKWQSITQPVVQELQKNRFSTNMRLSEFQDALVSDYVWGNKESRMQAFQSMQAYVDYILKSGKYSVPGTIKYIQLRAVVNKFPDYKNKEKPDSAGTFRYYPTNWWAPGGDRT